MDQKAILFSSPVFDGRGAQYICKRRLPYDGSVLRWTAEKLLENGQRGPDALLEEFCPCTFLPYLDRESKTGRLILTGGSPEIERMYYTARVSFFTRMSEADRINVASGSGTKPLFPPHRWIGEPRELWIVEKGKGESIRDFVEKRRGTDLSAAYVLQCLRILQRIAEQMEALRRRWTVWRLSPDTVLLSPGKTGGPQECVCIQWTDSAYILPRMQEAAACGRYPFPVPGQGAAADQYTDPSLTAAFQSAWVGSEEGLSGPDSAGLDAAGLYSAAQLLCYMLFEKTWTLTPETLFIHFPACGVLQWQELREKLEAIAALGLRLGLDGGGHGEMLSRFSNQIAQAMKLAETKAPM